MHATTVMSATSRLASGILRSFIVNDVAIASCIGCFHDKTGRPMSSQYIHSRQNHEYLIANTTCVSRVSSRSLSVRGDNTSFANDHGNTSEAKHKEDDSDFADIIIAGAGMMGRAMACAMGQESSLEHLKIVMVEGSAKPEPLPDTLQDAYSNRVCALSQASVDLLENVGAWSRMVHHRVQPIRCMQVWDACSDAAIIFREDTEHQIRQELGFIVENNVTVDALSRQLEQLGGRVNVEYGNTVKHIKVANQSNGQQDSWVQVTLSNGQKLKSRLLIGADGSNSMVRKLCRIPHMQFSYNQSAVVATLHLTEPTENVVAWQRFLPSGPLALLPLSNDMSSLVWSTNHKDAEDLLRLTDEEFVDETNNAFWDNSHKNHTATSAGQALSGLLRLIRPEGSFVRQLPPSICAVSPGSRAMFPLSLGHASYYVKPRIALIGDAAHRVHPLAGQGANLGFGDVAQLRDILVSAASMGKDIGCYSHLSTYETARQRHVVPVMAVIDGLKRLYTTDNPLVVLARGLGLQTANAIEPLKQQIIAMATGR